MKTVIAILILIPGLAQAFPFWAERPSRANIYDQKNPVNLANPKPVPTQTPLAGPVIPPCTSSGTIIWEQTNYSGGAIAGGNGIFWANHVFGGVTYTQQPYNNNGTPATGVQGMSQGTLVGTFANEAGYVWVASPTQLKKWWVGNSTTPVWSKNLPTASPRAITGDGSLGIMAVVYATTLVGYDAAGTAATTPDYVELSHVWSALSDCRAACAAPAADYGATAAVWVVDHAYGRAIRYNRNATVKGFDQVQMFICIGSPTAIACSNGFIYISDQNSIHRYTPAGVYVKSILCGRSNITAMSAASDGDLLVVDSGTGTMLKVHPN